jgi:hypothetical protein
VYKWCTELELDRDDSLGAGIGSSSWEMTGVAGALPFWDLVGIGVYSGWEISATTVRPSTLA